MSEARLRSSRVGRKPPAVPPAKRAGRAELAPEALQQCLIDYARAFFVADLNGGLRFASPRFRELRAEIADSTGADLVEALGLDRLSGVIATTGETTGDLLLPSALGRRLAVRQRVLSNPAGAPVAVCGVIEDAGNDARLAGDLATAQERLDDVTRLVSDWVWETDTTLAFSFVSPRIGETLHYHPRELIGRQFVEFGCFPEGEPPFGHNDSQGQPQPFRDIAYRVRRRDGVRRLLLLSGLPVFCRTTGAFIGYRGTARDVTEEIEARERVAESHRHLIEAIESISEGFALFDPEERLVLCNSKYRSMFPASAELLVPGIAFADFIRVTAGRGGIVLGDETPEAWCARQRERRRQGPVSFELQLGDGRWVKVGDRLAADGSTVGILTDITELKRREEALSAAKEFAEIASRSKSEFLANISHELRTPLNAIIGFTEIMRDEIFGPVGSRQYREYLGDILSSARHLLEVINDILDTAKAEAGKLELDEEDIDIADVIRAATRLVLERAHRSGLTIATDAPTTLPLICADERKLKQILLNLLTNAVKFTPRDGRIDVRARLDPSGDFILEVADTGIGIAPEHIDTALSPFGQVDGKLNRKYEGTGLGLPLTRALVELHDGALTIVSRLDEGTTVTVRLPATRVREPYDYGI